MSQDKRPIDKTIEYYHLFSKMNDSRESEINFVLELPMFKRVKPFVKPLFKADHASFKKELDDNLMLSVIKDNTDILRPLREDPNREFRTSDLDAIHRQLENDKLPLNHRMPYVYSMSKIYSHYFQLQQERLNSFGREMIDLSDQQTEIYNEMTDYMQTVSADLQTIHEHCLDHEEDVSIQIEMFQDTLQTAFNRLDDYQERLGQVNMNKERLDSLEELTSNQLANVQAVSNVLLQEWSKEDTLTGFEKEPTLQSLYETLVVTRNQHNDMPNNRELSDRLIRATREFKSEKARVLAGRQAFNEKLQTLNATVTGVSSVLGLLGENKLATQVAVVGQAGIQIASNIAGLMGIGMLAAVNPLALGVGIISAVGSVASLFGGDDSQEAMMSALKTISKQIAAMHQQMRDLFEETFKQIGQVHRDMLFKFMEIETANLVAHREIMKTLHSIHVMMEANFSRQSSHLKRLEYQITHIEQMLSGIQYKDTIDELYKKSNLLINHGGATSSSFSDFLSELELLALTKSVNKQYQNVDEILNPELVTEYLYAINVLKDTFSKTIDLSALPRLSNPWLFSVACQLIILSISQRYPVPDTEDQLRRLSSNEFSTLQRLYAQAERWVNFIHLARQPQLLQGLVENFSARLEQLQVQLVKHIEVKRRIQKKLLSEGLRSRLDVVGATDRLQRIRIAPDVSVQYGDWIDERVDQLVPSGRRNNKIEFMVTASNTTKKASLGEDYLQTRKEEIQLTKDNLIRDMQNLFDLDHASDNTTAVIHQMVMYPENPAYPNLPAPNFLPILTDEYLHAQMIDGPLRLTYVINNQEERFIIRIFWVSDRPFLLHELSVHYDPLFYSGNEAVWNFWVGGSIILSENLDENQVKVTTVPDRCNQTKTYYFVLNEHKETHIGMRERLMNAQHPDDIDGLEITNHEENLHHLNERIQTLQEDIASNVSEQLHAQDRTLGKVCSGFEQAYRTLYGYLAIVCHDTLSDPSSAISTWFATYPVNLGRMNQILDEHKDVDVLMAQIGLCIEAIPQMQILIEETLAYADDRINYTLLDVTTQSLELAMAMYKDFLVKANENNMSQSMMSDSVKALAEINVLSLSRTLKWIPKDKHQEAVEDYFNDVAQQQAHLDEETRDYVNNRLMQAASNLVDFKFRLTAAGQVIFDVQNDTSHEMPVEQENFVEEVRYAENLILDGYVFSVERSDNTLAVTAELPEGILKDQAERELNHLLDNIQRQLDLQDDLEIEVQLPNEEQLQWMCFFRSTQNTVIDHIDQKIRSEGGNHISNEDEGDYSCNLM